jgi:hypothetical protein
LLIDGQPEQGSRNSSSNSVPGGPAPDQEDRLERAGRREADKRVYKPKAGSGRPAPLQEDRLERAGRREADKRVYKPKAGSGRPAPDQEDRLERAGRREAEKRVYKPKAGSGRGPPAVVKRNPKAKTTVHKRRRQESVVGETSELEEDEENRDQEESNRVSFKDLDLTTSSQSSANLNRYTLLSVAPVASVWKGDKQVSWWFWMKQMQADLFLKAVHNPIDPVRHDVIMDFSAHVHISLMHIFQTVRGHREVQLFGPSAQMQSYIPEFHVCLSISASLL